MYIICPPHDVLSHSTFVIIDKNRCCVWLHNKGDFHDFTTKAIFMTPQQRTFSWLHKRVSQENRSLLLPQLCIHVGVSECLLTCSLQSIVWLRCPGFVQNVSCRRLHQNQVWFSFSLSLLWIDWDDILQHGRGMVHIVGKFLRTFLRQFIYREI